MSPESDRPEAAGAAELTQRFLSFSAKLTGFSTLDLLGTGLVETYARFAAQRLGAPLHHALDPDHDPLDPSHRDVSRCITELWYTGIWRDEAGLQVVSHLGYHEALVRRLIHPNGVLPAGFGSWGEEPTP